MDDRIVVEISGPAPVAAPQPRRSAKKGSVTALMAAMGVGGLMAGGPRALSPMVRREPVRSKGTNPHQNSREKARRLRQIAAGVLKGEQLSTDDSRYVATRTILNTTEDAVS